MDKKEQLKDKIETDINYLLFKNDWELQKSKKEKKQYIETTFMNNYIKIFKNKNNKYYFIFNNDGNYTYTNSKDKEKVKEYCYLLTLFENIELDDNFYLNNDILELMIRELKEELEVSSY